MFKVKVNTWTDGCTMDKGPWHKLAGLQPVELKIACYDQFLLFPQCFQKTCTVQARKNQGMG